MIYLYYGENEFAIQRQIGAVTSAFSSKHSADAITRLDASEVETQNLIAEIVNINMFAPNRLVILRGAEKAKLTWEKLGESLNRVPEETDLVIVAAKPDKRTKTYKDLLKIAKMREFPVLKSGELKNWLFDEARTVGLKINAEAINELLDITAGDPTPQARLAAEIAKFQLLGRAVDVELVGNIVEPNLATNAFEVLTLALKGDKTKVATELKTLRESGEDANRFFGLLTSQVFALTAAIFVGAGADTARDLKIHSFQLSKMGDLARSLGDESTGQYRVRKITKILAETDARMKISAGEPWALIEIALAKC